MLAYNFACKPIAPMKLQSSPATDRYDTLRFFIWWISTFKPTSKLW